MRVHLSYKSRRYFVVEDPMGVSLSLAVPDLVEKVIVLLLTFVDVFWQTFGRGGAAFARVESSDINPCLLNSSHGQDVLRFPSE